MTISLNDKVIIKPTKGCCNNTLCFEEWKVTGIGEVRINDHTETMLELTHPRTGLREYRTPNKVEPLEKEHIKVRAI